MWRFTLPYLEAPLLATLCLVVSRQLCVREVKGACRCRHIYHQDLKNISPLLFNDTHSA